MTEETRTITINNLVYEVNALPPQVQEMINTHEVWSTDLAVARNHVRNAQVEVNKLGFAIAGLNNEIIRMVRDSGVAPVKDLSTQELQGPAE